MQIVDDLVNYSCYRVLISYKFYLQDLGNYSCYTSFVQIVDDICYVLSFKSCQQDLGSYSCYTVSYNSCLQDLEKNSVLEILLWRRSINHLWFLGFAAADREESGIRHPGAPVLATGTIQTPGITAFQSTVQLECPSTSLDCTISTGGGGGVGRGIVVLDFEWNRSAGPYS